VYYDESFTAYFTPNYLEDTSLGLEDSIFGDRFESGDISHWSSTVTDGGNLTVATEAAYWGMYGMEALIDDNNGIYVQDDTPNGEQHYHARFYFNPNAITMASGDIFDLFQGYASSTNVFRIQYRKRAACTRCGSGRAISPTLKWLRLTSAPMNSASGLESLDWYANIQDSLRRADHVSLLARFPTPRMATWSRSMKTGYPTRTGRRRGMSYISEHCRLAPVLAHARRLDIATNPAPDAIYKSSAFRFQHLVYAG